MPCLGGDGTYRCRFAPERSGEDQEAQTLREETVMNMRMSRTLISLVAAACLWFAGANPAFAAGGHGGGGGGGYGGGWHGGGGGSWHGGGGWHGGGWHGGGWHGSGFHGSIFIGPYWGWYGYPYYWGYPYYSYYWGYPNDGGYPYPYAYDAYDVPYSMYGPAASAPYAERSPDNTPVYWYYCTAPSGYYPYVRNCSKPWMRVVPSDVTPVPDGSTPSAPSGSAQ
jgi:hypothetical protein